MLTGSGAEHRLRALIEILVPFSSSRSIWRLRPRALSVGNGAVCAPLTSLVTAVDLTCYSGVSHCPRDQVAE
jgi:hypothetical protein